jgi:hypothetical protein
MLSSEIVDDNFYVVSGVYRTDVIVRARKSLSAGFTRSGYPIKFCTGTWRPATRDERLSWFRDQADGYGLDMRRIKEEYDEAVADYETAMRVYEEEKLKE